MSSIMKSMITNYTGVNRTTEHTWDYVQRTVSGSYTASMRYNMNLLLSVGSWMDDVDNI